LLARGGLATAWLKHDNGLKMKLIYIILLFIQKDNDVINLFSRMFFSIVISCVCVCMCASCGVALHLFIWSWHCGEREIEREEERETKGGSHNWTREMVYQRKPSKKILKVQKSYSLGLVTVHYSDQ
jgi:hypothetical protein